MKKGVKILIFCVIGSMAFSSCKKEKIELIESNDPIFRLEGVIGEEAISLIAGDDNAYMFTMTQSVNGVNLYSGSLSNGSMSVELGIFDGLIDLNHEPVNEIGNISPLFSREYSSAIVNLSKELVSGSSEIQSIEWFVDNVFVGINEAEIKEPGKYQVCGLVTFSDGETASLCNEIIVGYVIHANCSIDFSTNQSGLLNANVNTLGGQVSSVRWFVDNQLVSENIDLQTQLSDTIHNVKAEVHFANGVVRNKEILTDGGLDYHEVGDFTIFETNSSYSYAQDFNIRLKIEHDGKVFSTAGADNSNATLSITGFEYYGLNSQNKEVYKVSAIINADVREVVTQKIQHVNFSTVFGIEIP